MLFALSRPVSIFFGHFVLPILKKSILLNTDLAEIGGTIYTMCRESKLASLVDRYAPMIISLLMEMTDLHSILLRSNSLGSDFLGKEA